MRSDVPPEVQAFLVEHYARMERIISDAINRLPSEREQYWNEQVRQAWSQLTGIPAQNIIVTHTKNGRMFDFEIVYRPLIPPPLITVTFAVPKESPDGTQVPQD